MHLALAGRWWLLLFVMGSGLFQAASAAATAWPTDDHVVGFLGDAAGDLAALGADAAFGFVACHARQRSRHDEALSG